MNKAKHSDQSHCTVCGVEIGYCYDRPCDFCDQPAPVVGMGVTYVCWTDCYAGTIIEVSKSGKTIKVQQDKTTRIDNNGMSESQEYRYEPNPNAQVKTFKITSRSGRKAWRSGSYTASVGNRRAYHDYSF